MHFIATASVAVVALAAHAAASAQPYRAMMPVSGMSLMRRDSSGYQPEQTECGDGTTCAEACGADFQECASSDSTTHCYNPAAAQKCCASGSGNSCDAGYYCTEDSKLQTWCCPDSMDLAACAAAYTITGGLHSAEPTSTAPASTSEAPVTPTTTSEPLTTSTASYVTPSTAVVTDVMDETTTVCPVSSGYSTTWAGSNSTITSATLAQPTPSATSGPPPATTSGFSGAGTTGVSALLLVAAGMVALF